MKKVLYTAKIHATGGRDGGTARSVDGRLEVSLSAPGGTGTGTNPEQLFAAGWSACFISAIKLAARLNIRVPGVEHEVAQRLVEAADRTCPYSRATLGNIDVAINLV